MFKDIMPEDMKQSVQLLLYDIMIEHQEDRIAKMPKVALLNQENSDLYNELLDRLGIR
jgi:hypothetical protein